MNIYLHLKLVGALLLALGLAHSMFGRYFNWRRELAQLSLLTRQIFLVHCFFIALLVVMIGVCSLFYTNALLGIGSLEPRGADRLRRVLAIPIGISVLRVRYSHLARTEVLHGHARGFLDLLDLCCSHLRRCITDSLEGMTVLVALTESNVFDFRCNW